jgi:high-affinity nickel-transport protein
MLLVYGLGLRHGLDVDHIAAIDNVTRKLMGDGKRPVSVGLYFALGHSAVVLIGTILVAHTARMLGRVAELRELGGGAIGVAISALFLLFIGLMNVVIFAAIFQSHRRLRADGDRSSNAFGSMPGPGGLLSRILRPLFALVRRSWHTLFIGFLFGLSFDTTTEVALFAVSGAHAAQGVSLWAVLLFPVLFAAGMALVDSVDGLIVLKAYAWALVEPWRRVRYNLTITLLSAVIALAVGGIEILGLMGERYGLTGKIWKSLEALNVRQTELGLLIIGLLAFVWACSYVVSGSRTSGMTADLVPATSPQVMARTGSLSHREQLHGGTHGVATRTPASAGRPDVCHGALVRSNARGRHE